jgi:hypothetical protein
VVSIGGEAGLGDRTLELGTTEVLENLLPVGWVVEAAEVGLQLATENLQRCALADTVCANQSQHLARPGHGQPVQLEAIGRVSMCDLRLEVRGQIDDVDGVEGAFLGADTAPNAEALRDEGDFGRVGDFDAQLARADHGTRLFAFLATFLGRVRAGEGVQRVALALGLHYCGEHPHVSIAKFAWRGSGACTLSLLTMAILGALVWGGFQWP